MSPHSTSLIYPIPNLHSSCFVRARRLNVIIQPHLRFVYELMKWDEHLQTQRHLQMQIQQQEQENYTPVSDHGDSPGIEGQTYGNADDGATADESKEKNEEVTWEGQVGWGIRREMDWPTICREIAQLNRPYSRQ